VKKLAKNIATSSCHSNVNREATTEVGSFHRSLGGAMGKQHLRRFVGVVVGTVMKWSITAEARVWIHRSNPRSIIMRRAGTSGCQISASFQK
jgi:hypothetical protein